MTQQTTTSVSTLMSDIADIGVDRGRGGYSRPVYSTAELTLREWFLDQAGRRGLDLDTDRNGIIWAWLDTASGDRRDAVVTGSHLDSVPGGGAFDGPLGLASALVAVDQLRQTLRSRPLALAVFPEEEGSRFGSACLGSRLLTGEATPDAALALRDDSGTTFAEACAANGLDPRHVGHDREALEKMGVFVELHVEQGRGLIDRSQPVAIGSSIVGHGRWRIVVEGQGNHAGTTAMMGRRDPMVAAARIVVEIRELARLERDARATVGRLTPVPGGTNVIASSVQMWVDVRHPDDHVVARLVEAIGRKAHLRAAAEGCSVTVSQESYSATATFDEHLRGELQAVLPDAPVLDTGAGHDAGILAAHLPTAMLFVRNPSGISHSPEEHVEPDDAEHGANALAQVLEHLCPPSVPVS